MTLNMKAPSRRMSAMGAVILFLALAGWTEVFALEDPFQVQAFRVGDILSAPATTTLLQDLATALSTTGLIAIQPDDEFEFMQARSAAFERICGCWDDETLLIPENLHNFDSGILSDGQTRRTTLGTATIGQDHPLPLASDALAKVCGEGTAALLETLRDDVAAVSNAFVGILDQLLLGTANGYSEQHQQPHLLRDDRGESYATVQSIVRSAKNLEHFHLYSKPSSAVDKQGIPTMKLHTDAGLFLAFVPGQPCGSGSEDASFFVQDNDGALRRAVFPSGSVAIMLGAGAENWLSTRFPLQATRHAVYMPSGESRAWYGMMHLVPETAYVQDEPPRTFQQMQEAMVINKKNLHTRRYGDSPNADVDLSVGCGLASVPQRQSSRGSTEQRRRRRLQHVEGPHVCNNSTNFFCWMTCLEIPQADQAEGFQNEGYSLYCLDPYVLAASGNRVSSAVEPCADSTGQPGTAMNTNCVGSWQPTAPGVPATEVDVDSTANGNVAFCYGKTSMYMDGFNLVGSTCALYLFPGWVLNAPWKLVLACLGSIVFGILMEFVIRTRREVVQGQKAGLMRLATSSCFYFIQLAMGYALMLVIMIYSVPLFFSVIIGLVGGHVLFNAKDSVFPANDSNTAVSVKSETAVGHDEGAELAFGPNSEREPKTEDAGVPEGSTPCCQHG